MSSLPSGLSQAGQQNQLGLAAHQNQLGLAAQQQMQMQSNTDLITQYQGKKSEVVVKDLFTIQGPFGTIRIDPTKYHRDSMNDSWIESKTRKHFTTEYFIQEQIKNKKEKSMFGEFKNDMKNFIKEHKGMIYMIAGLYLVDHFLFQGKFKSKLSELTGRLIGQVEKKVDAIGAPDAKQ